MQRETLRVLGDSANQDYPCGKNGGGRARFSLPHPTSEGVAGKWEPASLLTGWTCPRRG